ncbi:SDR family NAD(P)-dependent oxidoreductase [Streptomyces hirsutus]|uniref:SDR family NAD(P)-dependent oxidoreductase n=1 Tax=Streptomyces hirsutus TaxID=35620 RepID=UPI0036A77F14
MNGFVGQVAIVTGAGGGLGRAHALALAERGVKLVVNDIGGDGSGAETVVAEIVGFGGEAVACDADITDVAAVQEMVDGAAERWGRINILINNAGILRDKSFAKIAGADKSSAQFTALTGHL